MEGWAILRASELWRREKSLAPVRESNPDSLVFQPVSYSLYSLKHTIHRFNFVG
jgi:hypothetical protein